MSTDDFYMDPKQLLDEWLNQPEGRFGLMVEHIDPQQLPIVKQAFLDGYKLGLNAKKQCQWQEYNQK
jgi:hypothetical protein